MTILHFRNSLLIGDCEPSHDELNSAVRLDPWHAYDLRGVRPYISGHPQDPELPQPGWTASCAQ